MSILKELKRRKVVRIGIIYLAAAWFTVEIASVILPIFDVSAWVSRLLVLVFVLGFPVALALAWIFDITSEGIRRTDPTSTPGKLTIVSAGLLMLVGTAGVYLYVVPDETELGRNVVAVMACNNWTGDSDLEYLSDGLAEDIMNRVSRLRPIQVISRASTFSLKYQNLDVPTIANKLGAAYVLTCSLRKFGESLRISAQLIDAEKNKTLWSNNFDRSLDRIIDVLNEISVAVAEGMSEEVLGEDRARLAREGTANPQALDIYMRGRFHFNQMTASSHRKAQDYYQQALQQDPGYARAYAAIADSLGFSAQFESIPKEVIRLEILTALEKAIELDDGLADAWAVLGLTRMEFYDDWAGSIEALQRAYEINPNNLEANNYLRQYYAVVGPAEKQIPYAETAVRIDPLGTFTSAQMIFTYVLLRQHEKAFEASEAALALEPNSWLAYWARTMVFDGLGRYPQMLREIDKAIELYGSGENFDLLTFRARALAKLGRSDEAEAILHELQNRAKEDYVSPTLFAVIYEGLGRYDVTLDWLEKAYEEEDWILHWVVRFSMIDSVRDTPRFKAIMDGLGLKEEGYFDKAGG